MDIIEKISRVLCQRERGEDDGCGGAYCTGHVTICSHWYRHRAKALSVIGVVNKAGYTLTSPPTPTR